MVGRTEKHEVICVNAQDWMGENHCGVKQLRVRKDIGHTMKSIMMGRSVWCFVACLWVVGSVFFLRFFEILFGREVMRAWWIIDAVSPSSGHRRIVYMYPPGVQASLPGTLWQIKSRASEDWISLVSNLRTGTTPFCSDSSSKIQSNLPRYLLHVASPEPAGKLGSSLTFHYIIPPYS